MGRQRNRIELSRRVLQLLAVLVLAIPLIGCGGGGDDSGGVVADLPDDVDSGDISDFSGAGSLTESINGDLWLNQLIFDGNNRYDPRLPNYAYFQGVVQSSEGVRVLGQVRVIGGLIGADDAGINAYSGAMVTTNPYAFTKVEGLVGGPAGVRTRIGHWEEIPTP